MNEEEELEQAATLLRQTLIDGFDPQRTAFLSILDRLTASVRERPDHYEHSAAGLAKSFLDRSELLPMMEGTIVPRELAHEVHLSAVAYLMGLAVRELALAGGKFDLPPMG